MMHRLVMTRFNVLTAGFLACVLAAGCLDTMGLAPGPSTTNGNVGGATGTGGNGSGGDGGNIFTSNCTPPDTQSCYPGPPGTNGVGICVAGMQTCLANGTGFGPCQQAIVPRFDDCVTVEDEDCDGMAISACTGTAQQVLASDASPDEDLVFGVAARNGRIAATGIMNGTTISNLYRELNLGDLYVGVWNSQGKKEWSAVLPCSLMAVGRSVALFDDGSVVVVGEYIGSVNDAQGNEILPLSNALDAFAIRFDPMGAIQWVQRYTGTADQKARSVSNSSTNEIYVTGDLNGSADFGCGPLIPNTASADIFLAKLDAAGQCVWSRNWGDSSGQTAHSVAVAPNGDVVIGGWFRGSIDFGTVILTSAGGADAFLARFDGQGQTLWSKRFGDNADQFAWGVAAGPRGEIAMTGSFDSTIGFGGGPLSSGGGTDMFLAVFEADGTNRWGKRFGESFEQFGMSTAIDMAGHVLMAGFARGDIDFGGGPHTQNNGYDATFAKYSLSGAHEWSGKKGDGNVQVAHAVAVDEKGYVVLGGGYEGDIDFGTGMITSTGRFDMFVTRLAP